MCEYYGGAKTGGIAFASVGRSDFEREAPEAWKETVVRDGPGRKRIGKTGRARGRKFQRFGLNRVLGSETTRGRTWLRGS